MSKKFLELNVNFRAKFFEWVFHARVSCMYILHSIPRESQRHFTEMGMAAYRDLISNVELCHS
jgi:hypothetical protein